MEEQDGSRDRSGSGLAARRPRRTGWSISGKAVILSRDGLAIASSTGLRRDEAEQLSALAAGVQSLASGAGQHFGVGEVRQTIIELEQALLFITAAGHGSCLAVLCPASADAGLVAYEMAMLVKRAGPHLAARPRFPASHPRWTESTMGVGGKWVDRDSGPVVRPYAVTGGRTEPADGEVLDLIAVIMASGRPAEPADQLGLSPEHRRILGLCRQPATVADVASDTGLPVGVVRVLLADLIQQGRIRVLPRPPGRPEAQRSSCCGRCCMDSGLSDPGPEGPLATFKILIAGGFGVGQDHARRRDQRGPAAAHRGGPDQRERRHRRPGGRGEQDHDHRRHGLRPDHPRRRWCSTCSARPARNASGSCGTSWHSARSAPWCWPTPAAWRTASPSIDYFEKRQARRSWSRSTASTARRATIPPRSGPRSTSTRVPVVLCDARQAESAKNVLITLVQLILDSTPDEGCGIRAAPATPPLV